jgi:hypothetical protein
MQVVIKQIVATKLVVSDLEEEFWTLALVARCERAKKPFDEDDASQFSSARRSRD